MNNLSWLIYLADVIQSFGTGLAVLGFFIAVAAIIMCVLRMICAGDPALLEGERISAALKGPMILAGILGPLMWTTGMLMPSRQAMYLIAASEMGQQVYTNPGTQEILGDLKDIIGAELKKLKERK